MTDLIYMAAAVLGVILAFMPWMIYAELKRQGAAREQDALKIITLLARIASPPSGGNQSANEAANLQAMADIQNR